MKSLPIGISLPVPVPAHFQNEINVANQRKNYNVTNQSNPPKMKRKQFFKFKDRT